MILDVVEVVLTDKSGTGKERPWSEHKRDNLKLVDVYTNLKENGHPIYKSRINSMIDCGEQLTFAECPHDGYKKLIKAYFCKCRFCFLCTWRRSLYTYQQFLTVAHRVLEKAPKTQFLFITLTAKSVKGQDVKAEIKRLNGSFIKMFKYKRVKGSVHGFFRSTEVTYNPEKNMYHPHIHAILAVSSRYFTAEYIKQDEWTDLWQKALKVDYAPMVDVRKIKPRRAGLPTLQEDIAEDRLMVRKDLASAGAEVAKYSVAVKQIINPFIDPKDSFEMKRAKRELGSDITWQADVIHTLEEQLYGVRMNCYGGCLREAYQELKLKDVETADLVHMPDEEKEVCDCPLCQTELVQGQYLWNRVSEKFIKRMKK